MPSEPIRHNLLRTIRFDGTDAFVFENAAPAGEWAISGAFNFATIEPERLIGKTRQAFANGFLSLESFGWSTFVCVAEIENAERDELMARLASHLADHFGAPSYAEAAAAAHEEFQFVHDMLLGVAVNTVFAVRRHIDEDGQIREQFRTIERRASDGPIYARAWETFDDG